MGLSAGQDRRVVDVARYSEACANMEIGLKAGLVLCLNMETGVPIGEVHEQYWTQRTDVHILYT